MQDFSPYDIDQPLPNTPEYLHKHNQREAFEWLSETLTFLAICNDGSVGLWTDDTGFTTNDVAFTCGVQDG